MLEGGVNPGSDKKTKDVHWDDHCIAGNDDTSSAFAIPTLHPGELAEPCDHTVYQPGPTSFAGINVLDLFRQVSNSVVEVGSTELRPRVPGDKPVWIKGIPGSGFMAASDGPDCLIVTAQHVIPAKNDNDIVDTTYTVRTTAGKELPASIELRVPEMDLAVLRVEGLALEAAALECKPLPLAESSPGAQTAALGIGYPWHSRAQFVSPGVFNSFSTPVAEEFVQPKEDEQRPVEKYEMLVEHGMSGGPIVNGKGEVQAVTYAGDYRSSIPIADATPAQAVKEVLNRVKRTI